MRRPQVRVSLRPVDEIVDPRVLRAEIVDGEHDRVDVRGECRRAVGHEQLLDQRGVVVDEHPHRRVEQRGPSQRRRLAGPWQCEPQLAIPGPRQPPSQGAINVDLSFMAPDDQREVLRVGEELRRLRQDLAGPEPPQVLAECPGDVLCRASSEQLAGPNQRSSVHPATIRTGCHGDVSYAPVKAASPIAAPRGSFPRGKSTEPAPHVRPQCDDRPDHRAAQRTMTPRRSQTRQPDTTGKRAGTAPYRRQSDSRNSRAAVRSPRLEFRTSTVGAVPGGDHVLASRTNRTEHRVRAPPLRSRLGPRSAVPPL